MGIEFGKGRSIEGVEGRGIKAGPEGTNSTTPQPTQGNARSQQSEADAAFRNADVFRIEGSLPAYASRS